MHVVTDKKNAYFGGIAWERSCDGDRTVERRAALDECARAEDVSSWILKARLDTSKEPER